MTEPLSREELRLLSARELIQKNQEIREAAIGIGQQWAEKRKRFKDLKEMMPSFLAGATMKFVEAGSNVTLAKTQALASEGYKAKVKEMTDAEAEAILLEVEYKAHIKSLENISAISYLANRERKMEMQG